MICYTDHAIFYILFTIKTRTSSSFTGDRRDEKFIQRLAILQFEWSSINSNNESLAILASVEVFTKLPLLGHTLDIGGWIRQHAIASADVWKAHIFFDGAFREDKRLQMGHASAAHIVQRMSFLLAEPI